MSGARSIQREKLRRFFYAHRASIRLDVDEAVFAMPAIARGFFSSTLLERPGRLHDTAIIDELVTVVQRLLGSTTDSSATQIT